jgi:hypothetical protein
MGDRKNINPVPCPRLLALFQKRVDGDDALLHLARLRFEEVGLGTEFYAETLKEMDWLLPFKPTPETPAVIHLRRGMNLLEEASRDLIMDFATRYKDQVFGLVIHDQVEMVTRWDDYLAALREVARRSEKVQGAPYIYIEYAVGLNLEVFIHLFNAIRDMERVRSCIDIGHIGLWQARATYAQNHPGKDVCAMMATDPNLPELMDDVQTAVESAPDAVAEVIRALSQLEKPLHFHLHDGHPVSHLGPFGISDHLSFLDKIPIPFAYKGKRYLDPMFGPLGLSRILSGALERLGPDRVSFSLEIHPTEGRLPLKDASYLFHDWQDRTNAERMNHWLSVLRQDHELVSQLCTESLRRLQK